MSGECRLPESWLFSCLRNHLPLDSRSRRVDSSVSLPPLEAAKL